MDYECPHVQNIVLNVFIYNQLSKYKLKQANNLYVMSEKVPQKWEKIKDNLGGGKNNNFGWSNSPSFVDVLQHILLRAASVFT